MLAIVLPIGISWIYSPALSQNNQRQGGTMWGRTVKTQPEVKLREPMELADLPRFSGHSLFMGGHLRTTDSGEAVEMAFRVKESVDQVRDWYGNVLRMGQWKIVTDKGDLLSGKKNDNTCTVTVNPSKNKEYPTVLQISYFTGNNKN
jgi:hypothetical protein